MRHKGFHTAARRHGGLPLCVSLTVWLCWLGATPVPAAAQPLPSEPISLVRGRIVLGADMAVSVGPEDEGFFNYSDYEHSTLRELRLALGARIRVTDRVSVLADIRSENFERLAAFGLYVRVRPIPGRRFDIQFGRIPPVFGSQSRQVYGRDALLIGTPLAYQYLTSLRADAVPATADELLLMRGRGWLSNFSIGDTSLSRGVSLVSATHWDTGVQVSTGWQAFDVAAALTTGTPSRPLVRDDNRGKQVSARVTVKPAFGLVLGASGATGQFLARRVLDEIPEIAEGDRGRFSQQALGVDAEYSRGHALVRTELVFTRWWIPFPGDTDVPVALAARAAAIEGRYTVLPGAYVAARGEHLTFSRIAGSAGAERWDAPVTRVEVGGGYRLQRNVLAKLALQLNWRDGGRVTRARLVAGQLLYWF